MSLGFGSVGCWLNIQTPLGSVDLVPFFFCNPDCFVLLLVSSRGFCLIRLVPRRGQLCAQPAPSRYSGPLRSFK